MEESPIPSLQLRHPGGDHAAVSTHGAHLLSWRTADGVEHLYHSPLSPPMSGRAIRGGTPICFPQFATRGPLPKHGFVRDQPWEVRRQPEVQGDTASASLSIMAIPAGVPWPHPYQATATVRLGSGWIAIVLEIQNRGTAAFAFTAALHTYFAVDDVRTVAIHGLRSCRYEDALDANREKREEEGAVTFQGELDRVYLDTPAALRLVRPGRPELRVLQEGFTDTVVWNPGPRKAATLGDLPPEDWTRMVCIEAAVVKAPVVLEPGATWAGLQRIER